MSRKSIKAVLATTALLAVLLGSVGGQAAGEGEAGSDPAWPSIPLGLPADTWRYWIPADNPLTPEKIALGRRLFFDRGLSSDGTVSCADCHKPELGFTDGLPVATGVGGRRGTRNSMSLLNVTYNTAQFWDGRVDTLEEQALEPLVNPVEMGNRSVEEVIARLRANGSYQEEFRAAFRDGVSATNAARAIASFERTLLSGNSPFDRFQAGEEGALTAEARRGMAIFRGRGRCSRCHTITEHQPLFTNFAYQNTGVASLHASFEQLAREAAKLIERGSPPEELALLGRQPGGDELGRALKSALLFEIGSYRTPSLRNVGITAPYFHDGSARTLADVVRFYNEGGRVEPQPRGRAPPAGAERT